MTKEASSLSKNVGLCPHLCSRIYLMTPLTRTSTDSKYGISRFLQRVLLKLSLVWSATTQQDLSLKHKFSRRHREIAKIDYQFCHIRLSVCLSVCSFRLSARNSTAPITRIPINFYTRVICRVNCSSVKLTGITGTLHEDLCTFMIISR